MAREETLHGGRRTWLICDKKDKEGLRLADEAAEAINRLRGEYCKSVACESCVLRLAIGGYCPIRVEVMDWDRAEIENSGIDLFDEENNRPM